MLNQQEVIYHLDRNNSLMYCNDQWDAFAEQNGGSNLIGEKIRGRSVWDFIHDAETRHIHELLLRRVRARGAPLSLPFRCDSPELRRFMEMNISPISDGGVAYRCRVIKVEQRPPLPALVASVNGGDAFLRMCSWCNQMEVESGRWAELEDAVAYLDLFSGDALRPISHTICDACMRALDDEDQD